MSNYDFSCSKYNDCLRKELDTAKIVPPLNKRLCNIAHRKGGVFINTGLGWALAHIQLMNI